MVFGVVLIDLELDALDRVVIQFVRLNELDFAGGRHVSDSERILLFFRRVVRLDFHSNYCVERILTAEFRSFRVREARREVMVRRFDFPDLIHAVGKRLAFRMTVGVRGHVVFFWQDADVVAPSGNTADTFDLEDTACQHFTGQDVILVDNDLTLDRTVLRGCGLSGHMGCYVRIYLDFGIYLPAVLTVAFRNLICGVLHFSNHIKSLNQVA